MQSDAPPAGGWRILIPAHDEAGTIRAVVEGALAHGARVTVIDDGSRDGTADRLAGLPVEIVRHEENRGKGWRLAEGIDRAVAEGAEGVLTLDADGQHDPDDIPAFLAAAERWPGRLVVGDRFADLTAMPAWRRASISFGDFFISWGAGRRIRDAQCGMRLYPATLWRGISVPARERRYFVFETVVLMRAAEAGFDFARVPIKARYAGFVQRPSHFRPVVDAVRIVGAVTRFLLHAGLKPRGLLIALGAVR
jgi:glycosyltransferase involved in cell wall biosynthesis